MIYVPLNEPHAPFHSDIIKLTALFVARNGRAFMTALTQREAKNIQFEFMQPRHSMFPLFTQLLEQYTRVLQPPADLKQRLDVLIVGRICACALLLPHSRSLCHSFYFSHTYDVYRTTVLVYSTDALSASTGNAIKSARSRKPRRLPWPRTVIGSACLHDRQRIISHFTSPTQRTIQLRGLARLCRCTTN